LWEFTALPQDFQLDLRGLLIKQGRGNGGNERVKEEREEQRRGPQGLVYTPCSKS